MSISRITKERLYQDEELFNSLLSYAKYDEENGLFVNADAALWSIWELQPKPLVVVSDAEAFQISESIQEMVDSFESNISVQLSWITTFDVDGVLKDLSLIHI